MVDRGSRQAAPFYEGFRARKGVQGELRLGVCITAANALLPPILGLYRQRYPNVDLALQPGGSSDILGSLRRGELDVAFVASDALSADLTSLGEIPDEVLRRAAPSTVP